jgi:Uncharacterized alpha/beta hydrolase domain (DUF2235)
LATTNEIHTALQQQQGVLAFAAAGTPLNAQPTERSAKASSKPVLVATGNALAAAKLGAALPGASTCQQCLTLAFFFDGTGNNLDADVGTMQHSNIARLFQSHPLDSPVLGRFSFYIPGLGTYFDKVGDVGHTARGRGLGHLGQARLDWALARFDEAVSAAEKRAENPTSKIVSIKVSVFGFSRGATAARAFVRDLAARCTAGSGGYRLKRGNYPVEVIFLGIFDTVASVGLPMSANNTPGATTAGWYSTQTTVNTRASSATSGILAMAFGAPGADPAPGDYDGHASWADGLQIPAPGFVKRGVHMVAGHEMRNSFPVDSALFGTRYPTGVVEMVYPGAHSDVGGGYQPGEGARSAHPGEMLSLIPLRAMHAEARSAGVPLDSLEALQSDASVNKYFALDPEGAKKFAEVVRVMDHYMRVVGSGGRDIGRELLAHSAYFLRWRFFNIRRRERTGGPGADAQTIAQREPGFETERRRLAAEVARLEARSAQTASELDRASELLRGAQMTQARTGLPVSAEAQQRATQAAMKDRDAKDAYLRKKAELDTYADDSALAANLNAYDRRLVADAQAIAAHHKKNPQLVLRPHYRNLMDAYAAHYLRSDPLDDNVAALFDRYVHDSLAGFATDATLPSDPRVIYAGGDNKLRYAGLMSHPATGASMAA